MSTTVSSLPEVSRHPAGPEGDQKPPFDQDPPAGGACSGGPKLPKTGGAPADSGALAGPSKRQNPEDFQGLGVDVAYYGYRYYDPQLGRWISRDPIGERGGKNLYAFVVNLSLSKIDLFGLLLVGFGESGDINETGKLAAKKAYELTKNNQPVREYCGLICCRNGKYFASEAKMSQTSNPTSTCEPDNSPCPANSKKVGVYHSHPDRDETKYPENDFSYEDYEILGPDEINFLGNQNGIKKLKKVSSRDIYGANIFASSAEFV